jgi:hypothetical protein
LTLEGRRFFENTADVLGGAVHAHAAVIEMFDCEFEFEHNSALHGGATDFHIGSVVIVRICRYYENSAVEGGGLCLFAGCDGTIEDCTFAGNTCDEWAAALSVGKATTCHVQGCTFYDWIGSFAGQYGVDGDISADPLFCDPEQRDFRLDAPSPRAPFSPPDPECDLVGAWPVGCGGTPVEWVSGNA